MRPSISGPASRTHTRSIRYDKTPTRSRPNWITGPGPKSGSAGKSESRGPENGVSRWRRPNSDLYSQNHHFGLVYDWYFNFLAWRQRIISLVCFANNAIHPWPQMMPIFDQERPADSHLPFVYVVILTISPMCLQTEGLRGKLVKKVNALYDLCLLWFWRTLR